MTEPAISKGDERGENDERREKKDEPGEKYEPVIGLEIHAQLRTESKIFRVAPSVLTTPPGPATR